MKILPLILVVLAQVVALPELQAEPVASLNPNGKTVLMADDLAAPVPGITAFRPTPKLYQRLYVKGWSKTDQVLTWKIFVPETAAYEVEIVSSCATRVVVDLR